jgi:hypothetical protein
LREVRNKIKKYLNGEKSEKEDEPESDAGDKGDGEHAEGLDYEDEVEGGAGPQHQQQHVAEHRRLLGHIPRDHDHERGGHAGHRHVEQPRHVVDGRGEGRRQHLRGGHQGESQQVQHQQQRVRVQHQLVPRRSYRIAKN